ncbi:uncharacterized protein [Drosophila kikkawai]|uniref:Uncharacterized protein n=1 Tax=Drosophila kikkawai TaxID=30033 RepID=A0A6P4I293_DROKI|nr:uncharacterized protein LOC108070666 [Drosophila kikkawai]
MVKTKEAGLAEMDFIFMDDILPRCCKDKTTTQEFFKDHTAEMKRVPPAFREQTDASLIAGHYADNLKVDGLQMITKTWPRSTDWREEYNQFVKRNKWCNEKIYKLFFVNPPVHYSQIKKYLKDLRRTTYMSDYSPEYYISRKSQRRDNSMSTIDSGGIDYQTTYGNYHNRIQEVDPFKDFINQEPKPKDLTVGEFAKEMRKLFTKYNMSTYYEEICLPALLKAKDGVMPSGPIDRYTLRRL